jgi:hypothetical protein
MSSNTTYRGPGIFGLRIAAVLALVLLSCAPTPQKVSSGAAGDSEKNRKVSPRPEVLPADFETTLSGKLGTDEILLDLRVDDYKISGFYYNVDHNRDFELEGTAERHGRITVRTYDTEDTLTGAFSGMYDHTSYEGVWVSFDATRKQDFILKARRPIDASKKH